MSEAEPARFRGLARGELEVAQAWLDEGDVSLYQAHLREALRLEVLARYSDGLMTALEAATAVMMAESWQDDVEALVAAVTRICE